MFQEGRERRAERAFREIARLTRGAYCPFDAGSAQAAARAAQGGGGLCERRAQGARGLSSDESGTAMRLLEQLC